MCVCLFVVCVAAGVAGLSGLVARPQLKENDELKKLLQEAMVQLQAMKKQSVPTENKAHKAPATQPSSVNSTPKSHEKVSGQSPGAGSKSGSDKSHVEASSSPTPSNLKTPPARSSEQAVDNSVESAPKKQKTGDEKAGWVSQVLLAITLPP